MVRARSIYPDATGENLSELADTCAAAGMATAIAVAAMMVFANFMSSSEYMFEEVILIFNTILLKSLQKQNYLKNK